MKTIASYLMSATDSGYVYTRFRTCLYAFVLIFGVWKLIGFNAIYGPDSFMPPFPYDEGRLSGPLHLVESFPEFAVYLYVIYLLGAAYLVFRSKFWIAALVWILHLNFYNAGFLIMNGGDMLLSNVLLFMCIPAWNPGSSVLVNSGIWFVRLQVALIYLVSFLYKIEGSDWLNGSAIARLSSNSVFGSEMPDLPSFVLTTITYTVLIHQGLFPLLVWFRRLRPHILLAGTLIHLGIAVFMGLIDFGLIMILCYLPFLNDAELKKMRILPGKQRFS